MGLRWSSIGGQDEAGLLAATVNRYDVPGGVHWRALMAQVPLVDAGGEVRRFDSEEAARAAVDELVDEAEMERRIADLDASVADQ